MSVLPPSRRVSEQTMQESDACLPDLLRSTPARRWRVLRYGIQRSTRSLIGRPAARTSVAGSSGTPVHEVERPLARARAGLLAEVADGGEAAGIGCRAGRTVMWSPQRGSDPAPRVAVAPDYLAGLSQVLRVRKRHR